MESTACIINSQIIHAINVKIYSHKTINNNKPNKPNNINLIM